jgi:hypothetical protein
VLVVVVSAEIISALAPGATCVEVLPGVDGNPSGHGEDFGLTRSVPGRRRGALEGVEVDRGPRRPCAVRLLLPCVVQGSVGAGLEHFEASVRVRDDGCVFRQVSAETGGAPTIRCWAALAICGAARACPCPQSQAITWSRSSRSVLGLDRQTAEDLVRSAEPFWDGMERAGELGRRMGAVPSSATCSRAS